MKTIILLLIFFTFSLIALVATSINKAHAQACPAPSWTLANSVSGNTATISISPAAGVNSFLSITAIGYSTDIPIATGATSYAFTNPNPGILGFSAQLFFTICPVSNRTTITFGGGGLPGGGGYVTPLPPPGSGAPECTGFDACTNVPGPPGYGDRTFVTDLIERFIPSVLVMGGFLAVIFIAISGVQFITSGGNPDAAAAARSRLVFALVGFVLLVLAFAITKLVDFVFLGGSGIFT